MNTIIRTQGIFLPEEVQARFERKLQSLLKYQQRIHQVIALVRKNERNQYEVAIQVDKPGKNLAIREVHPQPFTALKQAVQRVGRMVRKEKERMRTLRRER